MLKLCLNTNVYVIIVTSVDHKNSLNLNESIHRSAYFCIDTQSLQNKAIITEAWFTVLLKHPDNLITQNMTLSSTSCDVIGTNAYLGKLPTSSDEVPLTIPYWQYRQFIRRH